MGLELPSRFVSAVKTEFLFSSSLVTVMRGFMRVVHGLCRRGRTRRARESEARVWTSLGLIWMFWRGGDGAGDVDVMLFLG